METCPAPFRRCGSPLPPAPVPSRGRPTSSRCSASSRSTSATMPPRRTRTVGAGGQSRLRTGPRRARPDRCYPRGRTGRSPAIGPRSSIKLSGLRDRAGPDRGGSRTGGRGQARLRDGGGRGRVAGRGRRHPGPDLTVFEADTTAFPRPYAGPRDDGSGAERTLRRCALLGSPQAGRNDAAPVSAKAMRLGSRDPFPLPRGDDRAGLGDRDEARRLLGVLVAQSRGSTRSTGPASEAPRSLG